MHPVEVLVTKRWVLGEGKWVDVEPRNSVFWIDGGVLGRVREAGWVGLLCVGSESVLAAVALGQCFVARSLTLAPELEMRVVRPDGDRVGDGGGENDENGEGSV